MSLEFELRSTIRRIRPGLIGASSDANKNLVRVIEDLKASPGKREELARKLGEYLATRDFITALTETGLTLEANFFSEVFRRIEYKFLPKKTDGTDALNFLLWIFDSQRDVGWLEDIDRHRFGEFLGLILPNREVLLEALAPQFFMALEILSLRLAGLGFDPVVYLRLRQQPKYQPAFMEINRHVHALLEGEAGPALAEIRTSLKSCQQAVQWIRGSRSKTGVSLALTYRLIKIQQIIERMGLISDLIESTMGEWREEPAEKLFFEIVLGELRRFDISNFIGRNVELLAYQITEHTGRAGEHYITRTRSEWWGMLESAAIGGLIVGPTAVCKIIAHKLHLAPVPEAILFGLIYSVGFLLVRIYGGTIATKQPAMTASTIAAGLDAAGSSEEAIETLNETIIRTVRSQLIAVLGNYILAAPIAAAILFLCNRINFHILPPDDAMKMMETLHPWRSLSFFYAAVAGVGLFATGLLAGFADNWFVYNDVAARLRSSEVLRRRLGMHNLERLIKTMDENLGFWVGDVSLGFYLGSMTDLGRILGLPLDIRHISFASAQLGAILGGTDFHIDLSAFALVAVAVLFMGAVNLAVSFSLTLMVVVRSRKIRFSQTPRLLKLLGRRFLKHPLEFIFPPADSANEKLAS